MGLVWLFMVVWCGVVWCGVVWCGVVWCGMVWYSMVGYGMVASSTTCRTQTQFQLTGAAKSDSDNKNRRHGAREGGGGDLICCFCLSHLTIDHAPLWRRSTVPTPDEDNFNIWALITLSPGMTLHKNLLLILSPSCLGGGGWGEGIGSWWESMIGCIVLLTYANIIAKKDTCPLPPTQLTKDASPRTKISSPGDCKNDGDRPYVG